MSDPASLSFLAQLSSALSLGDTQLRVLSAVVLTLLWLALCAHIAWRQYQQRRAQRQQRAALAGLATTDAGGSADDVPSVLLAYASQSGTASHVASQSAQLLHQRGYAVRLCSFNEVDAAVLQSARLALFIASTYGEGDAPDNASVFHARTMHGAAGVPSALPLQHLRYGLLALGDSQYAHFCGFARALDAWLHGRGAQPVFARIESDSSAVPEGALTATPGMGTQPCALTPEAALLQWQQALARHLPAVGEARTQAFAAGDAPGLSLPAGQFQPWTLLRRRHLNPGSQGGEVWLLELTPPPGQSVCWESGDLADIRPAADPQRPRSYSIANIPDACSAQALLSLPGDVPALAASAGADEGPILQLLVRQARRTDGTPGIASHWLTHDLFPGAQVPICLRAHEGFRLGDNARRPLILLGNGTGLAGLRSHLMARTRQASRAAAPSSNPGSAPCWLIFGERQRAHDQLCAEDLELWQRSGILARLDRCYSRDGEAVRYVQDVLRQQAHTLRQWVNEQDAAIYVCGSREGMGQAVDASLRAILGEARVDALLQSATYRRDVY